MEAGQPAQLTGTNRSIGFEHPHPAARTRGSDIRVQSSEFRYQNRIRRLLEKTPRHNTPPGDCHRNRRSEKPQPVRRAANRLGMRPGIRRGRSPRSRFGLAQAPGALAGSSGRPGGHSEGQNTRSHPELGRENPQRRWYCVSRRGRVGRRQTFQTSPIPAHPPGSAPEAPKPNQPSSRGGAAR